MRPDRLPDSARCDRLGGRLRGGMQLCKKIDEFVVRSQALVVIGFNSPKDGAKAVEQFQKAGDDERAGRKFAVAQQVRGDSRRRGPAFQGA